MLEKKSSIGLKRYFLQRMFLLLSLSIFVMPINAKILTSIKPLGFIAAAVADGVMETEVLLPDGASPHTYALKPSDIQRVRSADLVVWIGRDMEVFLHKIVKPLPQDNVLELSHEPLITALVRKGHEEDDHDDHHHHHGSEDWHIWLSPEIAKQIAISVHEKLIKIMPDKKDQLTRNLSFFVKSVSKTEQLIEKNLKTVQNSGYFVFHDAYGYFEHYFNLDHRGSFTLSPEIQPGAQKLLQIKNQILHNHVVCVFSEPQFQPAVIENIVKGTSARVGTLDPLGMNVQLSKNSYNEFLINLSEQFFSCLNYR